MEPLIGVFLAMLAVAAVWVLWHLLLGGLMASLAGVSTAVRAFLALVATAIPSRRRI